MKSKLSKLPDKKRYELAKTVEKIRNFADVEMIILFGSYARGDFVERDIYTEGRITYEYSSDFDILVVVADKKALKGERLESDMQSCLLNNLKDDQTRATVIVHTAKYINEMLAQKQYFFCDIIKEGITLYDSEKFKLAPSRKLTRMEKVKIVQDDFKHWDESANQFYHGFKFYMDKGRSNEAAFLLHQATERWYHAVCLVFTGYKKKTHNIEDLGDFAAVFDLEFKRAFPKKTEWEKECFKLLKKAYIDARYKASYSITKEQLEYLAKRVRKLRAMSRRICREKIASLKAEAEGK